MRKVAFLVSLLGLVLNGVCATTLASVYVNPPPFNPQRTLSWEFSSQADPYTPVTVVGPIWDSPGWECDRVQVDGPIQWFDTVAAWPGHQGLVGIDNSSGTTHLSGEIKFHVNNYPDPNQWKLLWDELVYFNIGLGFDMDGSPGTVDFTIVNHVSLPEGGYRDNLTGTIRPNPAWEEFNIIFNVPVGQQMYVDTFSVSTRCIPEPSTLVVWSLLGGLGIGAGCWRRRKRV